MAIVVNHERVVEEFRWWCDERVAHSGDLLERVLAGLATDIGSHPDRLRKLYTGTGSQTAMSDEWALRLLDGIDYIPCRRHHPQTGRMLPFAYRVVFDGDGRRRQPGETGRIKGDFCNAKLTLDQIRTLHRIHIEWGLSIRELARRGWQRWGFASEAACRNSLYDRMASLGLKCRSQAEAVVLASRTHGRLIGGRRDPKVRAAYKRQRRREVGPWPSDHPPPDWEKVRAAGGFS